MKKLLYFGCALLAPHLLTGQQPDYMNTALPVHVRVQDLLGRMTAEEKAAQTNNSSPAIERLSVPAYNWWNEALHGVARAGLATSFPQPVGLAATFNAPAIYRVGEIISDEARAKYHRFAAEGQRGLYQGLTFYSPNINIFRDPRWGRGHETFGEDPYLTGILGTAFVQAMQGSDSRWLKTICTAKHFAVHSGPEPVRHAFDAVPAAEDLWETYLPAFKRLVEQGGVYSVMCAYNRLSGTPCCSNPQLLGDILRRQWGFKGFVATDCGAVYDMFMFHGTAKDSVDGMAASVKAGVDNFCLGYPGAVLTAIQQGMLPPARLDTAVARLLTARMKLGMFDAGLKHPYAAIPYSVVNCARHRSYAAEAARQSVVLLKNDRNTLPLTDKAKTIAVIGPNADDAEVQLGNYNGDPAAVITILEGIKKLAGKKHRILYARGCHITDTAGYNRDADFAPALALARQADVIIFAGGISPRLEGEELRVETEGFKGGDKTNLNLPAVQAALLKALKQTGKPVVLLLLNGSALAINDEQQSMDAIAECWYGGEAAGTAAADVLFGRYNPAGRLPVTFYKSINDIPAFDDYSMAGKTYRYCSRPVLYPFGYGLSYTSFRYSGLQCPPVLSGDSITLSCRVTNTGKYDGDEVVQLYVSQQGHRAIKELKGFRRIHIRKGATAKVTFVLKRSELARYNAGVNGLAVIPGNATLMIGASSADIRLSAPLAVVNGVR